MIHLYGVVQELRELPGLPGLDGAPLERRQVDGLEVVVSRVETPPSAEVSREAVLRHAQVVEELMRCSAAVLPAQLGRAFLDDDELASALREQAPRLARGLERVRGCVEFGLRALVDEPPEVQAGSGADYMRARLDQVRREEALHERLARLAREATVQRVGGELRAAYLVAEPDADAFQEAVARLEREQEGTVVCTGPWPPYSFVEGER